MQEIIGINIIGKMILLDLKNTKVFNGLENVQII